MVRYRYRKMWCGLGYCKVYAGRQHMLTYENSVIRDIVGYELWVDPRYEL